MQNTMYHIVLRSSALLFALLLLFDSGLLAPITRNISHDTQQYVATAVGVGASVSPTELNTLTAQFTAKNQELDAREAALQERELAIGIVDSPVERQDNDFSTYILSLLLFVIIVLIVLNYALDFARERRLMRVAQ